jgi:hypothetical protein
MVMVTGSTWTAGTAAAVPSGPGDQLRSPLAAGDVERGDRRIDARTTSPAAPGQQTGERARTAADVDDRGGPELVRDREVDVEVAPVRVEGVVDLGEPPSSKIASATIAVSTRTPMPPGSFRSGGSGESV